MQLREQEINNIQAEVEQLPAVARVNAQLAASGGNIYAIEYTLVQWGGGNEAYKYCELPFRAPAYLGTCMEATPYTLTGNETSPYSCGAFSNGTSLAGADCIAQVDLQLDCKATCECYTGTLEEGNVERGCGDNRCGTACVRHCAVIRKTSRICIHAFCCRRHMATLIATMSLVAVQTSPI